MARKIVDWVYTKFGNSPLCARPRARTRLHAPARARAILGSLGGDLGAHWAHSRAAQQSKHSRDARNRPYAGAGAHEKVRAGLHPCPDCGATVGLLCPSAHRLIYLRREGCVSLRLRSEGSAGIVCPQCV